jgi:hypothetical protein
MSEHGQCPVCFPLPPLNVVANGAYKYLDEDDKWGSYILYLDDRSILCAGVPLKEFLAQGFLKTAAALWESNAIEFYKHEPSNLNFILEKDWDKFFDGCSRERRDKFLAPIEQLKYKYQAKQNKFMHDCCLGGYLKGIELIRATQCDAEMGSSSWEWVKDSKGEWQRKDIKE